MIHAPEGIAAATQSAGLPPVNGSRSRPRGVLVVDDNEAVRAFLGVGLEASGFTVWLAANGQESLAVCREHGSVIDFLVLDVCMPGWDGPETLAAIRTLAPDIPCCFMSGDTGRYTVDELLSFGAFAVLQKPFQLGELISRFKRLSARVERRGEWQDDHWGDDSGWG